LPVLGINLGHLGFLTSVGREDCDNLLEKLKHGLFKIEEHYLLKADWKDATKEHLAINEVCVRGLSPSELLETEVYVNGEYLSTYSSDGLIAATPTGSTAYSMSCGGPIISPQSKCICLTPISPHNLTHRPLIIPEDSEIEFRISHSKNQVSLHLDSQNYLLNPPARILIRKAEKKLKLVRMENNSFFSAIRNKLMWGTNLRNTNKND
jgi:NAD+ kinase